MLLGLGILSLQGCHRHKGNDLPLDKVWDDAAMRSLELPRASGIHVQHVASGYYYQIPERKIYKTYPIYAPGREPEGYWQQLKKQEPEEVHFNNLHTEADWVRAGAEVFTSAHDYDDVEHGQTAVRDPAWYKALDLKVDRNGVLPYYRYVIRERGKVEVTFDSCATCHTRILPNGESVRGAPGDIPYGKMLGYEPARRDVEDKPAKHALSVLWGAPWIVPDPTEANRFPTIRNVDEALRALPPGVNPRQGGSLLYPFQVPDLIGVKDRHYLDHTGLQHNRSTEDLMRYSAIQNFIQDELTNYGGFVPAMTKDGHLPDPKTMTRESDVALYALARYLESLTPPPNPNKFDERARRGQKVFYDAGCARCHQPPLYTNNKLVSVDEGPDSRSLLDHLNVLPSIQSDSFSTLKTRRGTGFYKVPSLLGVWYRGPFEHNGSVATLEDWFDPRRLRDDYRPTGYVGFGVTHRAVKGHEFGLTLAPEDKQALIAFLKTL